MMSLIVNTTNERAAIRAAVRILKNGGVIAFPTETTYGLAADPTHAKAIARIFKIKGRSDKKPLQLIAGSVQQVIRLAKLDGIAKRLAQRYWPGPLTLLLPVKVDTSLSRQVRPQRIVGIRVSSSKFVRDLSLAMGKPLAATSANRSGEPPAYSGRGVRHAFATASVKPDVLLDYGALARRKPSTIARITHDGIEIIRSGPIRIPRDFH